MPTSGATMYVCKMYVWQVGSRVCSLCSDDGWCLCAV